VVGKINQQFLNTINTYIKQPGKAFRTESGMARVIERKQRRQDKRGGSLERLNILSKVAARKDMARERLEKTAQAQLNLDSSYQFGKDLMNLNSELNKMKDSEKKDYLETYTRELRTSDIKTKYYFLFGVQNIDPDNLAENEDLLKILENAVENMANLPSTQPNSWGPKYYSKSNKALRVLASLMDGFLSYVKARDSFGSNKQTDSNNPKETNSRPSATRKKPLADLIKLRDLLTQAGHAPDEGIGWAPLDSAFRDAVEEFARMGGKSLSQGWSWANIARSEFNTTPDISGAEALVKVLIDQKQVRGSQASATEPETAQPETPAAVDKVDVVNGLESLFAQILSKQVKVDKEGLDMRRDSKDFRGVIEGLGGARSAASYCVEKCSFTPDENKQIIAYKNQPLEALAGKIDRSTVLSKIYRLFTDIRKQSRRPFRRGITQRGLAANVQAWLQGQRQAKEASISKSIEIRKAAARKKLGLQS